MKARFDDLGMYLPGHRKLPTVSATNEKTRASMNTEHDYLTALATRLLKELCLHPEQLLIEPRTMDGVSLTLAIQPQASDMGRLIGGRGATFNAFKGVMLGVARRRNVPLNLPRILEPAPGAQDEYTFKRNANWPRQKIVGLISECAKGIFVVEPRVDHADEQRSSSSIVTVHVSRSESFSMVGLMQEAFQVLFDAIARANGRELVVVIMSDLADQPDPPQPVTSAGRFVGVA